MNLNFVYSYVVASLLLVSASSFTLPSSRSVGTINDRKTVHSSSSLGMAEKQDADAVIQSVFGKELAFDEKTGRFFETKFYEEEKIKESSGETGIFDIFKKPDGSFFDELAKKSTSSNEASETSFASFTSEPATAPPAVPAKSESPAASLFDLLPKPTEISNSPPSFFDNLFKPKKDPEPEELIPQYERVTISPDFRVGAAILVGGLLLDQIPYIQLTLGPFVTLLGLLFLVQATRVRIIFTEDNQLQVVSVDPLSGETEGPGENVVVGGDNSWDCSLIVNYDFFPDFGSSPVGPILAYYKETQTDPSSWNDGPGKAANDPKKIESGVAVPGQVHFLPVVFNAEEMRDELAARGCGKL